MRRKRENQSEVEVEKAQRNTSFLSIPGVEARIGAGTGVQGVVSIVEADHKINGNSQDMLERKQGDQEVDHLAGDVLHQIEIRTLNLGVDLQREVFHHVTGEEREKTSGHQLLEVGEILHQKGKGKCQEAGHLVNAGRGLLNTEGVGHPRNGHIRQTKEGELLLKNHPEKVHHQEKKNFPEKGKESKVNPHLLRRQIAHRQPQIVWTQVTSPTYLCQRQINQRNLNLTVTSQLKSHRQFLKRKMSLVFRPKPWQM